MSQLEVGIISEDIWDINREDCARNLEEEARRIRTGETESLAVAIVSKTNEGSIMLQHMYVGTNPHREKPEGGLYCSTELTDIPEEQLTEIYNHFLDSIQLTHERETMGNGSSLIGFGQMNPDGPFLEIFSESMINE